MNGQLSFEDIPSDSIEGMTVSAREILGLIHALVAILENHME